MSVDKFNVLSERELTFYRANGYLVREAVFSKEECERMLSIFRSHADPTFRTVFHVERTRPEIMALVRDPRIVDVVEALHGVEMVSLGSQVLFKEPGSPYAGHGWRVHQDNVYVQARHGTSVSAIIPLVDSDPGNGGMFFYPGSQVEDLFPYQEHENFNPADDPGREVEVPAKYKKADLIIGQGSLYIQHGNLLHGSYPNTSSRPRPHWGIMYIVKGEQFAPGNPKYPRVAIALH